MDVDDVLALQFVNVAVRKQAVEQQKAQIGDARFRKRRQALRALHTHLPVRSLDSASDHAAHVTLQFPATISISNGRDGTMEDENVGVGNLSAERFGIQGDGGLPVGFGLGIRGVRPSRTRAQASVTMPVTPSTKVSQG